MLHAQIDGVAATAAVPTPSSRYGSGDLEEAGCELNELRDVLHEAHQTQFHAQVDRAELGVHRLAVVPSGVPVAVQLVVLHLVHALRGLDAHHELVV